MISLKRVSFNDKNYGSVFKKGDNPVCSMHNYQNYSLSSL